MKKLMILAAVAMLATVSQASKVNWSAPNLVDAAGIGLGDSTLEPSVVYSIWAADGSTLLVDAADGTINALGNVNGSWSGASQNTTYWIQAVLTDKNGATLTSEKAKFTTDGSSTFKPNLSDGTNMAVSGSKFDQSGAKNGWVGGSGDVPEPTSGLLLLLGVAGLALKRRRI